MTNTEKMEIRIAELLVELKSKIQIQDSLEKDLADAYLEGKQTESILKKLSDIKNSRAGILAAVKKADFIYFSTAKKENEELSAEFEEEEKKVYDETMRGISKSILTPINKTLSGIVPKEEMSKLTETIIDQIGKVVWVSIGDSFSKKYAEIPLLPQPVKERDDFGNKMDTPVTAFGREGVI